MKILAHVLSTTYLHSPSIYNINQYKYRDDIMTMSHQIFEKTSLPKVLPNRKLEISNFLGEI